MARALRSTWHRGRAGAHRRSTKELELDGKNIDVIWNGYTITDERKEKTLMSEPYMKNKQVILVVKDSDIKKLDDLAGKTIAVQEGSSAQGVIQEDEALSSSVGEIVAYKDYVTALMDIDSGQMDALGVDLVVADYYMAKSRPVRYTGGDACPEEYGIGFRKGEQAFHDAVRRRSRRCAQTVPRGNKQ
jgi:polar amino acid transport system substrate-binding protein